jgi:integrase
MRVLGRLRDPVLLISQTCLETGARISEVTGLSIRHVDLERGCVRISPPLPLQSECRSATSAKALPRSNSTSAA